MTRVCSSVLVQRDAAADVGLLLGDDDAGEFDEIRLSSEQASDGFRCGVWASIDGVARTLIDFYEEEWVDAADVGRVLEALERHEVVHPGCAVLDSGLVGLIRVAESRGVPVIIVL
jgi:hypothetical protein